MFPYLYAFRRYCRFCATARHFLPIPTSSLPQNLPWDCWEYVYGLWATKSEGVGLIVRAISFQDCQPMWSWSTNQRYRQMDGRHAISECFLVYFLSLLLRSWIAKVRLAVTIRWDRSQPWQSNCTLPRNADGASQHPICGTWWVVRLWIYWIDLYTIRVDCLLSQNTLKVAGSGTRLKICWLQWEILHVGLTRYFYNSFIKPMFRDTGPR